MVRFILIYALLSLLIVYYFILVEKPINHNLLLVNTLPKIDYSDSNVTPTLVENGAKKRSQPTEKLKWRFRPPGFDSSSNNNPINDNMTKKDKKRKSIESPTKEEKKKKHKRSQSKN